MSLGVFVNSSDGFQDCWTPFFTLFQHYADALRGFPVYLNTERAAFACRPSEVISTKVWPLEETARPSWSECLLRGLAAVKEDLIFYMQEDYFLKRPIREDLIRNALNLFEEAPETCVVYLSEHGPRIKARRPCTGTFLEIVPPAEYLINLQAAIWDKEYLRSVAKSWENAWMFEIFGSARARKSRRRFFGLTEEAMRQGEAIDYVWTGVMKGKWKMECVELFRDQGIDMDFSRRGYYRELGRVKSRREVLQKLFERPLPALRSLLSLFSGT